MDPNVKHGFDLLGWLCKIITSFDKETQVSLFRKFGETGSIRERYYCAIEQTFDFLNRRSGARIKLYDSFSEEQLNKICQQVIWWQRRKNDYIFILAVLSYIERYFDFQESVDCFMRSAEYVSDDVVSFHALNNNNYIELQGRLLPNFIPTWNKGGRSMRSLAEHPLSIMEKYIWAPYKAPWRVSNFYSASWNHSKKTPVRIVCSPLSNESTFEYILRKVEPYKLNKEKKYILKSGKHNKLKKPNVDRLKMEKPYDHFKITKYYEDRIERVQSIIEQTIRFAEDINADIALFPEMLASPQCQQKLQSYIDDQEEIDVPLTILPSAEYYDSKRGWINETQVIDNLGNNLFSYQKQHAFQLDKDDELNKIDNATSKPRKYFEPITTNHNLYVLHMGGIGRVAIIICADIFDTELVDTLLLDYQVSLLIVLAYTDGFRLFFDRIALAQNSACEVIWCNSCSAYERNNNPDRPCVSYFSFGHKDRRTYCENSCGRKIPDVCSGCVYEIQIDSAYTGKGAITRKCL